MKVDLKVNRGSKNLWTHTVQWPGCTIETGPREQVLNLDIETLKLDYSFHCDDRNLISIEERATNQEDKEIIRIFRSLIPVGTEHNYHCPIPDKDSQPIIHCNDLTEENKFIKIGKIPYNYSINKQVTIGLDEIEPTLEQIEKYNHRGDESDEQAYARHAYENGHLISEKNEKGSVLKYLEYLANQETEMLSFQSKNPRAQSYELR